MVFASGFTWFHLIPAVDHDSLMVALGLAEHSVLPGHEVASTSVYLHAWMASGLLITLAVLGRMGLERAKKRAGIEKWFADEGLTPFAAVEVFASGIKGMMSDLLNRKDTRAFFPLIAALFAYIFTNNIMCIVPGLLPATDNINTNAGMALVVFLTFNAVGLSRDAVGYIKHLAGPVLFLAPLMFPIELVSLVIRPVSLTIRLTANMFGDHQVFTILSAFPPFIGIPVGLLALAILVSVIQAFVFSLLTVIYINLSLPHGDHDHDDHAHGAGHDGDHAHAHAH